MSHGHTLDHERQLVGGGVVAGAGEGARAPVIRAAVRPFQASESSSRHSGERSALRLLA